MYGQPISFSAVVRALPSGEPTPTGMVQFMLDGANFGSPVPVVNGIATSASIALPVGAHSASASFSNAQGSYLVSSAALVGGVAVAPAPTSTTLVSSNPTSLAGLPITFTATVATLAPGSGTPQGSVIFMSGSTPLATVPLAAINGVAQANFTTSALSVGTATITATYFNSDGHNASSTGAVSQVILGTGATPVGTTLYVVGVGSASNYASFSPAGSQADGSTGMTVSATLNGSYVRKTISQPLTALVIYGSGGNDTIQLAPSLTIPTTIYEGNGNNVIRAGGNDTIYLGGGNNQVMLGNGANTVTAGNGNNTVMSGDGSNVITLGDGNNYVHTGNAIDVVALGKGNDVVQLGNGNKTVTAGNGNDFISAGTGNDSVRLGSGNDTVMLGAGGNIVTLGNGNDFVSAGDGDNTVTLGNGNDFVMAGNGANLVVGGLGQHTIMLGNGNDILVDGSATLAQPGDSFRQVLSDWNASPSATVGSRLKITDNAAHPSYLAAGAGRDWFFYTSPKTSSNRKTTDRLN